MCGIAGTYGFGDRQLLLRMARVLAHRGPDGEGLHVGDKIGLAHRRLSIIDLSDAGRNPMYSEDGRYALVHNGEIYNFRDLRPALQALGHRFTSLTDTEVILHGHEAWGDLAVTRFNGMFAYALWDDERREVVLARDRFGVKPLYYTRLPGGAWAFASEVKALLVLPGVRREVDPRSLHEYLNLRYVAGNRTMFQGIYSIPPGTLVRIGARGARWWRYWRPRFQPGRAAESYYVKGLRRALANAVNRHMISDVPVGIYLSGGLDSSTFVALAAQGATEPLRTFCMGFGEPSDEFADARRVADAFKTEHEETTVKAALLRDLPRMIWHLDAPRRNLYPYFLAEAASRKVTVVQNGLGGDELFGGYGFRYRFMEEHRARRRSLRPGARRSLARAARTFIAVKAAADPVEGYPVLREVRRDATVDDPTAAYLLINAVDEVYDDPVLEGLYGPRLREFGQASIRALFAPHFRGRAPPVTQVMSADLQMRMVYDFLPVDDATGMAFSLENRVPFLDAEVVDFALTIPPELKWHDGEGKYILKKAMQDLLPRETLHKKKQGFSPNILSSYRNEVRDVAAKLLPRGALVREGWCRKEFVRKLLRAPTTEALGAHQILAWKMVAFEVWHQIYIENNDIAHPRLDAARFY